MKDLFDMKNPNIYLTQIINYFKTRKQNIIRLMTTNSSIGNLFSFSNFISQQKEFTNLNGIEILSGELPLKNSMEWNKRVQLLVLLFSQRAPSSLFQFFFGNFNIDQQKKKNIYFTVEMFNEAIAKRISDLTLESSKKSSEQKN